MCLLLCTACWPTVVVCSWYTGVILTQQWVKCQCAENIWRQTNIFLIHASTLLSDTRCSLLKVELSIIIPLSHWWKPQERIKALLQVRSHDMTTGKTPWIPKISLINKAWLTGSSLPVWLLHMFSLSHAVCDKLRSFYFEEFFEWLQKTFSSKLNKSIWLFVKKGPFLCSYRLQQQRCKIIMLIKMCKQQKLSAVGCSVKSELLVELGPCFYNIILWVIDSWSSKDCLLTSLTFVYFWFFAIIWGAGMFPHEQTVLWPAAQMFNQPKKYMRMPSIMWLEDKNQQLTSWCPFSSPVMISLLATLVTRDPLEGPRNKDYLLAPNLRKIALLTIAHEHILPKTASTETLSSDW